MSQQYPSQQKCPVAGQLCLASMVPPIPISVGLVGGDKGAAKAKPATATTGKRETFIAK